MRFRPVYIRPFQCVSDPYTSDPSNTFPPSIHQTLPMRFRHVYITPFQCVLAPLYIIPFQCVFAPYSLHQTYPVRFRPVHIRPFQRLFTQCTSDPSYAFPTGIHQILPMRFRPVKTTSDPSYAFPPRIHRLATSVLIKHELLFFSPDLQTCNKSFQYNSKAYPSAEEAICGLKPCL